MADESVFSSSYTLKDVGNIIKLREEIDQQDRIGDYIRSNLSVTDIIPTDYYLSLGLIDQGKWAISYDPSPAITEFQSICSNYNVSDPNAVGLRLWLTDDSVAVDSLSNNYDSNVIEDALNSMAGASRTVQSLKKLDQLARSQGSQASGLLGKAEEATLSTLSSGISTAAGYFADADVRSQLEDVGSTLMNTAAGVVFHGKKLSLPKIWKSSTYSPSLTFTLKLVSPYGDPKAIKYYIIDPLTYVMILASPRTKDGVTYGLPRPVWVNGYGSTSLNLAYIETVNIRRGGRETSYNVYKQPLVLDIAITVKPLAEGFAAVDADCKDWVTLDDAESSASETPEGSRPSITTVGNLINSLRPAPENTISKYYQKEDMMYGYQVGDNYSQNNFEEAITTLVNTGVESVTA